MPASNKCKHGFDVDKNGNHIIPRTTDELIEEAKKIINRKEPTEEPKQKPQPNINEIKRLARLLQDYRNI
jgi:hypothetical protein